MFGNSKLIEIVALVYLNLVSLSGNLICEYTRSPTMGYTCLLSVNQSITGTNDSEILGQHIDNSDDSKVMNCDVKYLSLTTFPPICKKFNSLKTIYIYKSTLQFFEAGSFNECTRVTHLFLRNNNFSMTLPGMFKHNLRLQRVDLSGNKIGQLHRETFEGLANLQWLDLRENRIKVLHTQVFAPLTRLYHLDLASNQISQISPETFAQTIKLKYLNLEDNKMQRLNAIAFGTLLYLEEIYLTVNAIEEIDVKVFEKLPALETFAAKDNLCINKSFTYVDSVALEIIPFLKNCTANWNERICKFPTAGTFVCTLTGLELTKPDKHFKDIQFQHAGGRSNQDVVRISAKDSVINFLPESLLAMFGNLEYIALNNVRLQELSGHSLRNCSQLGVIDLSRNEIQKLYQGTFTECRNLERILLNSNKITSIETGTFAELSNLNHLDLSYNQLTIIPSMDGSFLSLKSLHISGNRIESLTSTSLQSLGRLKVLRLDRNSIKFLGPEAFINLHDLEELHLQNNFISEIKPATFRDASKLKYLNLENNFLQSLNSSMFGELSRLNYLDISSNKISFIDEEIFNKALNIEFLFATDNQCVDANFEFEKHFAEQDNPLLMKCFEKV